MELIGRKVLETFKAKHADARAAVERWERLVWAATWRNFSELRRTLASADQVKLERELVITVFNIGGNKYRLISEVVYSARLIRALMILSHPEYARGRWKRNLLND